MKDKINNLLGIDQNLTTGDNNGTGFSDVIDRCVAEMNGVVRSNIEGLDLRGADLRDVDLRGANLSGVDLRDADLRGANLSGVNVIDACFVGATFDENTILPSDKYKLVNGVMLGSDLICRDVVVTNTTLSELDLSGIRLDRSNLSNSEFSNTNLIGAYCRGVNFRNCIFNGVDLRDADVQHAFFLSAKFDERTILPSDKYKLVNGVLLGPGLDCRWFDFYQFDFTGISLVRTNLDGANLDEAIITLEQLNEATITQHTVLPKGFNFDSDTEKVVKA